MPADSRPRRLTKAALTVALALLSGCVENPNSVFHSRTEFNRDVGGLFELLLWLGTIVFVFTEALLLWTLWKYRSRPGKPRVPDSCGICCVAVMIRSAPCLVSHSLHPHAAATASCQSKYPRGVPV